MNKSYTTIYFNNRKLDRVFNATLSNDFYEEALFGTRSIIEAQIPGRKAPYFYGVQYEPLEFEVVLGMVEPMDIYELKEYIELFYTLEEYVPMAFEREDGFITPTFYVINVETPTTNYLRNDEQKYFGSITLNLRCDAPYGYEEGHYEWTQDKKSINIPMASFSSTNYVLKITNENSAPVTKFILKNESNGTFISFDTIYKDEIIEIDGRARRITAAEGIEKRKSIYEDWSRTFMELSPKLNTITHNQNGIKIELTFRLPRLF